MFKLCNSTDRTIVWFLFISFSSVGENKSVANWFEINEKVLQQASTEKEQFFVNLVSLTS